MTAQTSSDLTDRAWVTRCALSRICGVCARPLGRPIAFVGSLDEVEHHAFHLPPLHLDCARDLAGEAQQIVTTAAFEFVRSAKEDLDRRPSFQPSSLL